MLERCISFFWECILVNLGSYIMSAMLLVIACKRPHSKIIHHFTTVLKCLSACQLGKTVKYEIPGNFLLTWSPNFGWHFQVIWYFDMKSFWKHYLDHCQIKKIPQDSIPCTLHSWPKEMHCLEKILNLHRSQWDLSSFTNSKTWHTLRLFKISGELFEIFEWVFSQPVSNSHYKIQPCRGPLTLTLGHRGIQWIYGAFLLRLSVYLVRVDAG